MVKIEDVERLIEVLWYHFVGPDEFNSLTKKLKAAFGGEFVDKPAEEVIACFRPDDLWEAVIRVGIRNRAHELDNHDLIKWVKDGVESGEFRKEAAG